MTPEPYTRETLGRIRALSESLTDLAIAAELGWPPLRLHSVARRHDIRLGIAKPQTRDVKLAAKRSDPPTPDPPAPDLMADLQHPDGIRWYRGSGRIERHGVIADLTPVQAEIFDVLLAAMRKDPGAPVQQADLPVVRNLVSMSNMREKINGRMVGIGLEIRGHKAAGFRLVDLVAKHKEAAA